MQTDAGRRSESSEVRPGRARWPGSVFDRVASSSQTANRTGSAGGGQDVTVTGHQRTSGA